VVFDAHSLDEIDKTYQSIADLGVKLKAVREENSRHGQVIIMRPTVAFHCYLILTCDICRLALHCHSKLYSKLERVAVSQHRPTMCIRPHDC